MANWLFVEPESFFSRQDEDQNSLHGRPKDLIHKTVTRFKYPNQLETPFKDKDFMDSKKSVQGRADAVPLSIR